MLTSNRLTDETVIDVSLPVCGMESTCLLVSTWITLIGAHILKRAIGVLTIDRVRILCVGIKSDLEVESHRPKQRLQHGTSFDITQGCPMKCFKIWKDL